MKIRNLKQKLRYTVATLALGALTAFPAVTARADDTSAEIRLLKARLKQLEEKVAKQDRERKAARVPAAATAGPPIMAQTPVYAIPKIPGSSDQKPAYPVPVAVGLGVPGAPPSYETGGLAGLEARLKGYPYIGPSTLFLNGVTITPGGFFELASVTRSHFMGADIATPFGNIPFANIPSSHVGEFHFPARRSRAALLVRGDVTPTTHLAGYGEFDWLGAAQTANLNQTDSFNLRIRHLYMTVDDDDFGAHLLAGHAFSLATMNIIGILPRKENTPIVIEDQYVPGFVWARQDQIRVVKDFDQKLWFALSAEQPATTFTGVSPTVPTVINVLPGARNTRVRTLAGRGLEQPILSAWVIPPSTTRAVPSNSLQSAQAIPKRLNQSRAASGKISIRDPLAG
jgi:outer membrane murein-binding lipoprotein Lpp